MGVPGRLIYSLALFFCLSFSAFAQQKSEPADSVVTLISSKVARLLEIDGVSYRKVVGPAKFLHNNTYLLCDTALWNVETGIIDAVGNVKIIQQETELQSEKMIYHINSDLAEFRGNVVQLKDKDNNILRTKNLDYNTKDSIAVFRGGGSMRDKDGQIIESQTGIYESKIKLFTFNEDVNMFTDSIFVKTTSLKYESDKNLATFGYGTDAWKEENMLSANAGWYDRSREMFFFRKNVHVMSDTQEGWSDSLYFHRNTMNVGVLGNAQVTDTTRKVSGLAGCMEYVDSLSRITMRRKPAVVAEVEESGSVDTVYFGADTLVYYTRRMCDIDSSYIEVALGRIKSMDIDPVSEFRRKAAAEAAKKAEEEAKNDPNRRPDIPKKDSSDSQKTEPKVQKTPSDSVSVADSIPASDTLSVKDSLSVSDSLFAETSFAVKDSLAAGVPEAEKEELDTTKIGFVTALGNVKVFKKNMQIVCDSLEYCDIDSIARLFKGPVIWNEIKQQYCADSVYALVRGNMMEKVSLMSNAFVHMQEDSLHYDQIKGAEMTAYFDENSQLSRFDALGGAAALFYLEENGVLATANKKESKMLSAIFKDGEIHKVYYFDAAKSDGYPVAQMTADDQKLKGFAWQPERRPADRNAVTPLKLRSPERKYYSERPRARFVQTGLYFPGYIDDIYVQIEQRDSLRRVRDRERQILERDRLRREQFIEDSIQVARLDSIAIADSVAFADSLAAAADSLALSDSLAFADSLRSAAVADSLARIVPTKEQLKEQARKERQAKKEARKAEKEARWARKDQADADKVKAKEEKKKDKERRRKLKLLENAAAEARKDSLMLEKYKEKFAKELEKEKASKSGKIKEDKLGKDFSRDFKANKESGTDQAESGRPGSAMTIKDEETQG